jgi:hypothetical protein
MNCNFGELSIYNLWGMFVNVGAMVDSEKIYLTFYIPTEGFPMLEIPVVKVN